MTKTPHKNKHKFELATVTKRWRRGIWVFFGLALILSGMVYLADVATWPILSSPLTLHNPDAWLRLSQIRDWISGSDFYSHAVPRTDAPEGSIVSHWTRPVDMIVAGLTHLAPGLFINMQLLFAAAVFPLALAAVVGVLLVAGASRIFRHNHVIACTLLLFIASPYMPEYFRPGDVDHHGLMSVLWCGAIVLLLHETPSRGQAFIAGLLSGIIIWISPEGLMPLAALAAVTGLTAMNSQRQSDIEVPVFIMLGAAFAVTAGLGVETPPDEILTRVTYDTLSIVHVALLWLCAAAGGFVMLLWQFSGTARGRSYIVVTAGLSAALVMYGLYPRFFLGPFADADPYVTSTFLPMVQEAQPLFSHAGWGIFRTLAVPGLAFTLACLSLLPETINTKRRFLLRRLLALMTFSFALCLFQSRWLYYLEPLAIMTAGGLLPAAAVRFRLFRMLPRRWQPYLLLIVVTGLAMALSSVPLLGEGTANRPTTACLDEMRYVIESQQLQVTAGMTSGVMYVMEDLAGETLFFTPYRVIAGNYHREASGLKDMQKIRDTTDISVLRDIFRERQVNYILDCPVYHKPQSALRQVEETPPDWLLPVEGLHFYTDGDKPVLLRVMR